VNFVEALSLTSLFAVALSAHVWMYDAAVLLPAVFYAMSRLREPWRTRVTVTAYLLAAAWMPIVFVLRFNPLAIVTIGGALIAAIALLRHAESAGVMVSLSLCHGEPRACPERSAEGAESKGTMTRR
jgi:hypothetical protein